jgi:hypothetical protein
MPQRGRVLEDIYSALRKSNGDLSRIIRFAGHLLEAFGSDGNDTIEFFPNR